MEAGFRTAPVLLAVPGLLHQKVVARPSTRRRRDHDLWSASSADLLPGVGLGLLPGTRAHSRLEGCSRRHLFYPTGRRSWIHAAAVHGTLLHVRRHGDRHLSRGGPLGAALKGQDETGTLHGLHVMSQSGLEYPACSVGKCPDERLIFSCPATLAGFVAIVRVIERGGEDVNRRASLCEGRIGDGLTKMAMASVAGSRPSVWSGRRSADEPLHRSWVSPSFILMGLPYVFGEAGRGQQEKRAFRNPASARNSLGAGPG